MIIHINMILQKKCTRFIKSVYLVYYFDILHVLDSKENGNSCYSSGQWKNDRWYHKI